MKKIKIITFHSAHNYGAVLQCYALQKVLEKYEVQIINYRNRNIDNSYKVINPTNIKTVLKSIAKNLKYFNRIKSRYNKFEQFLKDKINLTKQYNSEEELKAKFPEADIYITGSDQVWNTEITQGLQDSYTLNFGNATTKRISYAASIGKNEIAENQKDVFKKKISNIDYISVREEKAKKVLSEIIERPIEVVLDPTLLIDKNVWEREIKDLEQENEEYILAYTVEPDEEYYKIINNLSEKTKLKVIHFEIRNKGIKNELCSKYTANPFEFISLIKNAKYIVCTSFHATVFSIIFNKKFFVIPHRKTGSRVTNLLERLNIENRVYHNIEEFNNIDYNFETDWEKVNLILQGEMEKSTKWLNDAIEG